MKKEKARLDIRFMKDIFSSNFDSDCHFLGFFTLELEMDIAGSGEVNEEIRNDRYSCSRTRFRSREPHSKQGRDDEYRERRHKRDKPTQEWIPPSRRSSSTPSSSSSDNRQATESRPRLTPCSVLYHAKSRKRSRSHLHSSDDRSRSDKRGHRNNQKQGYKADERYAFEQVSNLAFRVERMEGFLEQNATHMGLSSRVLVDAEPGPGSKPQRPGATLGPHHDSALPKRSVDLGRRRNDDEVSLLASDEGIPHLPQVGQDLSEVCFNPVPDVTTKWSPHDVITSCVSKYFSNKPIKKPFQLRS